jgi:hypothetical protein
MQEASSWSGVDSLHLLKAMLRKVWVHYQDDLKQVIPNV